MPLLLQQALFSEKVYQLCQWNQLHFPK